MIARSNTNSKSRDHVVALRDSITFKLALIVMAGLIITTLVNLWASIPVMTSLAELASDTKQVDALGESRLRMAELHRVRRSYVELQIADCARREVLDSCVIALGTQRIPLGKDVAGDKIPFDEVEWVSETHVRYCQSDGCWTASFDFKPVRPLVDEIAGLVSARDHLNLVIGGIKGSLKWTLVAASVGGIGVCLLLLYFLSRKLRAQYVALRSYIRALAEGKTEAVPQSLKERGELSSLAHEVHGMSEDLAAAQRRLLEAERMSVWQTMARKVAHEIKNPLTPIALAGEQLVYQAKGIDDGPIKSALLEASRVIAEETQSLNRMVKEFTSFARLPKPQRTTLDLNAVVKDFIARNESDAAPQMKYMSSGGPAWTNGDAAMLHQVLHNLVNNARLAKHPERATVTIRLSEALEAASLADSQWHIDVEDNGPGVPPEFKATLFDAYVTSRSTGDKEKGMGLGLTISRQIARDHLGDLFMRTTGPSGTVMRLSLPKLEATLQASPSRPNGKEIAS